MMNKMLMPMRKTTLAAAIALVLPLQAGANDGIEVLREQVEVLQRQLEAVQQKLDQQERESASKEELADVKREVSEVSETHSEWKDAGSVVHLAGYGAVGYTDAENEDGSFDLVTVNPIFHYQYKDLFLLELELEIELEDDGETEIALEYGTIDWFVNDYAVLQAGKFLSPIGQFRQNIHPTWINKFASAPPGFGHDGAAPLADVGAQVRGGFAVGNPWALNYAVFVGNGPRVELEGDEIHGVESEGFVGDDDGEKVFGGRVGLLPMPSLEIGISAAIGDVGPEDEEDLLRDYEVYGVDAAYRFGKNLEFRGEWVRSEVGSNSRSAAPDSAEWEAWYVQGAYRFLPTKLEAVLRYSDFDSPHADDDQEQLGIGVNYWFAPNAVAKLGYEFNDGLEGESADDDRLLLQLSYGF